MQNCLGRFCVDDYSEGVVRYLNLHSRFGREMLATRLEYENSDTPTIQLSSCTFMRAVPLGRLARAGQSSWNFSIKSLRAAIHRSE